MRFEEVLPALRDGQAIQRLSQPIKWAYLKRSEVNGAFHWYGYGDDPTRGSPMNLDHVDLLAEDWVVVDAAVVASLKPPATFNCPRRGETGRPAQGEQLLDHWRAYAHNTQGGKRSCSYCGSLHADDFMLAARDGVEIGPTDKSYKAYLNGPGFEHAKFYFQHLDVDQRKQFVDLLNAKGMKVGYPGYFYTPPFFVVFDKPAATS